MASSSKAPSASSQPTPSQLTAAGGIAYVALLVVVVKLVRALLLAHSTHSTRPWLVLPLAFGYDLLLVALAGVCMHALARVPWRPLRLLLGGLAVLLLVLVHVFDVGAYELTGGPLTFQRLRGDEGGTLSDLGLVARRDLWLGVSAIVLLCASSLPVLRFAPRLRFFQRASSLRVLVACAVVGAAGGYLASHYLRRSLGLETQSAVTLATSVFDDDGFEGHALSKAEWARLLAPGAGVKVVEHAPPRLPSARPKNVVIFVAEGIPFEHTGFSPQDKPNPTPHLVQRMQRQGMLFTRYYAHWHASNQALFSLACSSLPPLGGDMMRLKPRIDCGELSQVMHDHGLHAGLFHGGHFSFYNKLALLGRRNYEVELDAEELMRANPKWQRTRWGTDDRAMVDATFKWVDSLHKGDRFAALLVSIAPHYPFELPRTWTQHPFRGNGEQSRYLNGVYYIDDVFEELIRGFEARGLADDTLFVFLGDHGLQVNEPPRITPGRRSFYEPSLHVPLVFINPRLFPASLTPAQRLSNRVAGHQDLLPTVLDLLGDEPDPRHHGQTMFHDEGWPRRTFFSAIGGKHIGFVEGDHKFVYQPRVRRTEYYDLSADPDELHDLSDKFPERMERYTSDVVQIASGLNAQIAAAPVLNESITMAQVFERFRKNVVASVEQDGKSTPCTPNAKGDNRSCPGVGNLFAQKDTNIMGEPRRCLFVKVPEAAKLHLRVSDPVTMSLLTATVATISRRDPRSSIFHIDAQVDGQPKTSVVVNNGQAEYVDHARGRKYVEYTISRDHKGMPDAICLQLTKMEH